MTELQMKLFSVQDTPYGDFMQKTVPTVPREQMIGIRLPTLRRGEKEWRGTQEAEEFLTALPHEWFEENLLHAIMISECRDFQKVLKLLEDFLPYVDNWAVCDTLRPKVFAKNTDAVLPYVKGWISSDGVYICRFGVDILMTYFLDEAFDKSYLALPTRITPTDYYASMMVAWFFATALAKQWESTVPYIEGNLLPEDTHRRTIQKAIESFRITEEQKQYLRTLRRARNVKGGC